MVRRADAGRAVADPARARLRAGHEVGRASDSVASLRGFDSTAWYGLLGPAGLPAEVVARWTGALAKVGKATIDQINATGCDTEILSPAKTVERIKADYEKWGRVVKDANIRAE